MKRKQFAALSLAGPRFDVAVIAVFAVFLFFCMNVWTEPFALGAAFVAVLFCVGRRPWQLAGERFSVPALGFLAFAVVYGAAAIYSPFGGSAVRDFRGMLPAIAVGAVVLLRLEKGNIRRLLWVLAAICALLSLLCTSFACEGLLHKGFCTVMDLFEMGDTFRYGAQNTPGRVNGIYNDANVSASILSLGALISLYLVQSGRKWWERLAACVLLSLSAVGILLSVSRGAILCFGLSLLVWLIAAGKENRLRLFLLMVISAGVSFAAFVPASTMVEAGAVLPNVLAAGAGGVIFLLDWAVVERVVRLLSGREKVIAIVVGVMAVGIVVFVVAALNITGPFELPEWSSFVRSEPLAPGEYTVFTEGEFHADDGWVLIYKVSDVEVLLRQSTVLYDGPLSEAAFTVPADSSRVFFEISSRNGGILQSVSLSDGTKIPLDYKLLPEVIAARLNRGLFSDNSYLLRVQYMKDALKIFMQKPVFGHGLGSTDNLYPAVQPFYYTSRYVHSHILQIMADVGLMGLVSFLALIGGALWLLVKQIRSAHDLLSGVLLACWVMINSHSLMEINFSVQSYQCFAFVVLLIPVALYAQPLSEKAARIGGAAVCLVFWVYLAVFGGLLGARQTVQREYATMHPGSMDELMSSLENFAKRDLFEPEPYQVEYVASAVQSTEGLYDVKMMEYVKKFRRSGNYPTCATLPENYYLPIGDFKELFACSRECLLQRASYADIWDAQMNFYRTRVLSAAGAEHADEFLKGVLDYQSLLDEVNQNRIEEIVLSEENQVFLNLVNEAAAAELSGAGLYDYLVYAMGRDGIA